MPQDIDFIDPYNFPFRKRTIFLMLDGFPYMIAIKSRKYEMALIDLKFFKSFLGNIICYNL